jgi:hypothetical protein
MKVIAILLISLLFPISAMAEEIPIINPVELNKGETPSQRISISKYLFYGLIAGNVIFFLATIYLLYRSLSWF